VNPLGAEQGVVQHIAAGAGDRQQGVLGAEIQGLAVHRRVFPTGVVDQVVAMHEMETLVTEPLLELLLHDEPWPTNCYAAREDMGCEGK